MLNLRFACLLSCALWAGSCSSVPPDPTTKWSKGYSQGLGELHVKSIAVDADGAVLVLGEYGKTPELGGNPLPKNPEPISTNVFLLKLSADGALLWSKGFYAPGTSLQAGGIAVDGSRSIIITGLYYGPVDLGGGPRGAVIGTYLAKYGPDGAHIFSKAIEMPTHSNFLFPSRIAVDDGKDILLGGHFFGSVDFGGGPIVAQSQNDDAYLAKYSPAGAYKWLRQFGKGGYSAFIADVKTDKSGAVTVIGDFEDTVDFGGGPLKSSLGGSNFLAKYDADGGYLWALIQGFSFDRLWNRIAVEPDGGVWFTGSVFSAPINTNPSADIWHVIEKYSAAGMLEWSKKDDFLYSRCMADDFGSIVAGGDGFYLAKLDATGNPVFSRHYGHRHAEDFDSRQTIGGVAVGNDRNIVFAGDCENPANFGAGSLPCPGIFVVKRTPE